MCLLPCPRRGALRCGMGPALEEECGCSWMWLFSHFLVSICMTFSHRLTLWFLNLVCALKSPWYLLKMPIPGPSLRPDELISGNGSPGTCILTISHSVPLPLQVILTRVAHSSPLEPCQPNGPLCPGHHQAREPPALQPCAGGLLLRLPLHCLCPRMQPLRPWLPSPSLRFPVLFSPLRRQLPR